MKPSGWCGDRTNLTRIDRLILIESRWNRMDIWRIGISPWLRKKREAKICPDRTIFSPPPFSKTRTRMSPSTISSPTCAYLPGFNNTSHSRSLVARNKNSSIARSPIFPFNRARNTFVSFSARARRPLKLVDQIADMFVIDQPACAIQYQHPRSIPRLDTLFAQFALAEGDSRTGVYP